MSKKTKKTKPTTKNQKAETKKSKSKVASTSKTTSKPKTTPVQASSDNQYTNHFIISKPVAYIAAGIVVVALVAAGFYLQNEQIVAQVNGEPITVDEYMIAAEAQTRGQVLDALINEKLIDQAAAEQGIQIDPTEIDAEINNIQSQLSAQGQDFQQVLAAQGLTEEGLRQAITRQLTLERMAGISQEASAGAIDAFLEENADTLPDDLSEEELRDLASEQILQQESQSAIQQFLQQLRTNAEIIEKN